MRLQRIGTGCLVLSVAALAAWATSPAIEPGSGRIGMRISFSGLGFPASRTTRIRLVPRPGQPGLRAVAARTVAFLDERVDVELVRGRAGVYDVVVVPGIKGFARVRLGEPFTILGPSVATVDRVIAGEGSRLRITGSVFGPHLGKAARADRVTLGGRALEIIDWSDSAITCAVTSTVFTGSQPLVVSNAAGSSGEPFHVFVTPPGEPAEFLRADVFGAHFEVDEHEEPALSARLLFGGQQLLLDANPGVNRLTIRIDFPKLDKPTPFTLPWGPGPDGEVTSLLAYFDPSRLPAHAAGSGPPLSLTVTGWHDGILEGTFDGSYGTYGNIENGAFRVHVDTVP